MLEASAVMVGGPGSVVVLENCCFLMPGDVGGSSPTISVVVFGIGGVGCDIAVTAGRVTGSDGSRVIFLWW